MADDHKFEKDLAIIQLKATIASTLGSILISMGIAIVLFSYTFSQNPLLSDNPLYFDYVGGILMIAMGIGILIGSLSKKTHEIRKL